MQPEYTAAFCARFRAKIDFTGPCHIWRGARQGAGYGVVYLSHRSRRLAHRVAWELAFGSIPPDLCILHRCDNRLCVNAEMHLFMGSRADNLYDMWEKGRGRNTPLPGEANPGALLTDLNVRAIRDRYDSGRVTLAHLADEYGVTKWAIWRVVNRRNWRHIP
jgi:hypothetical protein